MGKLNELDFLVSLNDQISALESTLYSGDTLPPEVIKSAIYSLKLLLETKGNPKRTSYIVCMGHLDWKTFLEYKKLSLNDKKTDPVHPT